MKKLLYAFIAVFVVLPMMFEACESDHDADYIAKNEESLGQEIVWQGGHLMRYCDMNVISTETQRLMDARELELFTKLGRIYRINYNFLKSPTYTEKKEAFLDELEATYLDDDSLQEKQGQYLVITFNEDDLFSRVVARPESANFYQGNVVFKTILGKGDTIIGQFVANISVETDSQKISINGDSVKVRIYQVHSASWDYKVPTSNGMRSDKSFFTGNVVFNYDLWSKYYYPVIPTRIEEGLAYQLVPGKNGSDTLKHKIQSSEISVFYQKIIDGEVTI